MRHIYFLALLLLGLGHSGKSQNIYPEKFDGCVLPQFCLDCGDPKAAYPTDLTAYFQGKLPASAISRFKGMALVQVLVDSTGRQCVLSQVSNLGPDALRTLNLRGLINSMDRWMPAREKGKAVHASSSLRFVFDAGQLTVSHQRFDFSKQTNLRSVGKVELVNKRQHYPAHPKGAKLQVFTQQNSIIPWDMMRAVVPDHDNVVWVGTDNGLVKIEKGAMTLLNASNSGLRESPTNKVGINQAAVDAHNVKWFADGYHAYRYDGKSWTRFDSTSSPLRWITNLHADAAGNVWFGGGKNLVKYDGKTWTEFNAQNSKVPQGLISGVFVDKQQRVWVGTYKGNVCLKGEEVETFSQGETPLAKTAITSAAEDADGTIWFGLYEKGPSPQHNGLAKLTPDGKWTAFTAANSGFPGNDVLDLVVDKQRHVVWASVNRVGLCRFDGTTWTLFTPENSTVPSTYIQSIALDAEGTLWCASHAGLLKLEPR